MDSRDQDLDAEDEKRVSCLDESSPESRKLMKISQFLRSNCICSGRMWLRCRAFGRVSSTALERALSLDSAPSWEHPDRNSPPTSGLGLSSARR